MDFPINPKFYIVKVKKEKKNKSNIQDIEIKKKEKYFVLDCNNKKSSQIKEYKPQEQDKKSEIRYTKNADFTDEIAADFLSRNIDNVILKDLLKNSLKPELLLPFYA